MRVSLAALIAIRPGCAPRLIYRVRADRRRRKDRRKALPRQTRQIYLICSLS
jgi:hypothetical protein